MPNRTPRQTAVLTEGARIAKIIAERAPRIDYTPAMLAEARGFYSPGDIAAVEGKYSRRNSRGSDTPSAAVDTKRGRTCM